MKLQELSGLTNADPIHRYLGLVDRILGDYDWNNLDLPSETLTEIVFHYLKHPVLYPKVEDNQLDDLENCLQECEPLLAKILNQLRRHKDRETMNNVDIRIVLLYVTANIDDLKERSKPGRRKINAGWKPSCE